MDTLPQLAVSYDKNIPEEILAMFRSSVTQTTGWTLALNPTQPQVLRRALSGLFPPRRPSLSVRRHYAAALGEIYYYCFVKGRVHVNAVSATEGTEKT